MTENMWLINRANSEEGEGVEIRGRETMRKERKGGRGIVKQGG